MGGLRVIFAVEDAKERDAFAKVAARLERCVVHYPLNIADVEALYSDDAADAIVTDFRFHNGALADWLTIWPLPAVLLTDGRDDLERIERTIRDESSTFVEREPDGRHLELLPVLIRKVINIRESLARQNAHLQMTEHQYMNLLQAVPDTVYILDKDGRFMYLNPAVRDFGYEPAKLIGKHFSEIVHPVDLPKVSRTEVLPLFEGTITGPESSPKLFDERRTGARMTKNLEVRLKYGEGVDDYAVGSVNAYGEVSCAGYKLPEFEGMGLGTVGVIRDVSARKEHERKLESALAAKEVLLKEIHHRVKNNLQVVSSLLNLQESAVADPAARKVFLECQTQIQSMAMVHEVLYRSSDFEGVDMQKYFERLVDYLAGVYDAAYRGLSWSIDANSVALDLDEAIPIALIVNELVSNSLKHAFPDGRQGGIRLALAERGGDWLLEVSDDGIGFEASRKSDEEKGIGTDLVHALAAQLHGHVSFSTEDGAVVRILFPRTEADDEGASERRSRED
jgi:PAS domain S-box-containing protein